MVREVWEKCCHRLQQSKWYDLTRAEEWGMGGGGVGVGISPEERGKLLHRWGSRGGMGAVKCTSCTSCICRTCLIASLHAKGNMYSRQPYKHRQRVTYTAGKHTNIDTYRV